MMKLVAAAVAVSALVPNAAHAQVTYDTQTRSIRTSGGLMGMSFTESAPDFGPFSASRDDRFVNEPGEPANFNSRGFASQSSSLNPWGIRALSAFGGTDNYGSGGAGSGLGRSALDITFSIADAQPWSLIGTVASSFSPVSEGIIRLTRQGATIYSYNQWIDPSFTPGAGTLQAGTYRFEVSFLGGYAGFGVGSGSGSFDLTLNVPAPAAASFLLPVAALAAGRRR